MKYIGLIFSLLSMGMMACLYAYCDGKKDIPAFEYQGGVGFAINAPMWAYGILALLTAGIGNMIWIPGLFLQRREILRTYSFWIAVVATFPALTFWIRTIARMV